MFDNEARFSAHHAASPLSGGTRKVAGQATASKKGQLSNLLNLKLSNIARAKASKARMQIVSHPEGGHAPVFVGLKVEWKADIYFA